MRNTDLYSKLQKSGFIHKLCSSCNKEKSVTEFRSYVSHNIDKLKTACIECTEVSPKESKPSIKEANAMHAENVRVNKKINSLTIVGLVRRGRYIYYECRCDCGNNTIIVANYVIRGKRKSCGCKSVSRRKINLTETNFNHLYSAHMLRAKRYSRDFSLTKDEFKDLTSQNCYYCGREPQSTCRESSAFDAIPYIYNGLDRVDNSKGYSIDNVVTCCKKCNFAKMDSSLEDFKETIEKIYRNFIEKEILV